MLLVCDLLNRQVRTLWPERSWTATASQPPQPTRDGRLVFFTLDNNIWSMTSGGDHPSRVTSLGTLPSAAAPPTGRAVCDMPRVSPDGKWLAYRHLPGGGRPAIRLCRSDGRGDTLWADGVWSGPGAWSPDSSHLVYAHDGQLWRIAPSQTRSAAVTEPGPTHDAAPAYLADGRLLFSRDLVPTIRTATGAVFGATPGRLDGRDVMPSPDGQRLAMLRDGVDPTHPRHRWVEVHVVTTSADSDQRVLSTDNGRTGNGQVRLVGWLDSARLLVVRDVPGDQRKLYSVDVDTRATELLLKAQDQDEGFALWPSS
jgi:Tol biopolymer transport system component